MKPLEVGKHLIVDPRTCFGKLTFKGTRVPVETILNRLAIGRTIESLLKAWPQLTREAIEEAVKLAAAALIEKSMAQHRAADESAHSGRSA
jgi:uncharacterized protein (DUF433 family)